MDPDQARHDVGPDLGPNYLQRLSADDTSRLRCLAVVLDDLYCTGIAEFALIIQQPLGYQLFHMLKVNIHPTAKVIMEKEP